MKHDPSSYIGIGKEGFRGPDPFDPFYDELEISATDLHGRQRTNDPRSKVHFVIFVFALIAALFAYIELT
jgi:hypothetical protein